MPVAEPADKGKANTHTNVPTHGWVRTAMTVS
jgi:hypothetical protein